MAETGREPQRRHMCPTSKFILEREFQKDPNWDSEKLQSMANMLNLGRTKVYKWHWDRLKKSMLSYRVDDSGELQQSLLTQQLKTEMSKLSKKSDESPEK